jgi:thiol-disulfide isomerase/thioredoxin
VPGKETTMSFEFDRRAVRRALAGAFALALLLAPAAAVAATGDVRLPGLSGGQLTSADLARGSVVLVVWAGWSPRCRDIVERVNAIQAGWGGRARVVTVNFQEEPAAIEQFLAGKKLAVPVYLDRDGAFSKSHSVTALPGLIVFRDGQVRHAGKLPADPAELLNRLLG